MAGSDRSADVSGQPDVERATLSQPGDAVAAPIHSAEFFSRFNQIPAVTGQEIAPGDRIGQYEMISPLGKGGMGQVWLARHMRLECERAVKLLHAFVATDRHWRARMLREAKIVAQLNHPNIAALYEFIEQPERSCIVLEYVQGHTLADEIARHRGPMPLDRALTICRQIAKALSYAHSRDHAVVHRDLKPRNVMIRPDGVAKVLDWGIALVSIARTKGAAGDGQSRLGQSAQARVAIAGTPGYMSPEQACGKQADRRADIWAFGCVLFECLVGRPAFPQQELDDFVDHVMRDEPDWSLLPADVDEPLRALLRKCLSRDVRTRLDRIDVALEQVSHARARRGAAATTKTHIPPSQRNRPRAHTPTNLPPSLASFIGRERELATARSLLESHRVLTLTGTGGTGKTALAVRLARTLAADGAAGSPNRFDGGVWLVELAPVSDPAQVAQAICAALPNTSAHKSSQQAVDVIVERLADQRSLLVIDNCEHVCDGCSTIITEILRRCAGVTILATSRQPLGIDGEQVYRVPPLSVPREQQQHTVDVVEQYESVRLFVERATSVRHDFALTERNAPDVAKVCRMLDGLPLAIELAAARIGAIAVGQLAERLRDVFPTLDHGAGRRTDNRRRRELEATIQWSYDLLTAAERRLLVRLSVFRGGWTLEAAEQIVADAADAGAVSKEDNSDASDLPLTAATMLDLLESLVDKSLVVFEEVDGWPRYRMLETVRLFADRELLRTHREAEVEALRARHAEYFCAFAEQMKAGYSGPTQPIVLERIENDHDNFCLAMEWALKRREQADLAIELATALHWFWFMRGWVVQGLRWIRAALKHRGRKEDLLEARALNSAGMLALECEDAEVAREFYEQSLAVLRKLRDRQREANVLNNLAHLAQTYGDGQRARQLYSEAIRILEETNDHIGVMRTQLNAAALDMIEGRYDHARDALIPLTKQFDDLGDSARSSEAFQLLAEIAFHKGDIAEAAAHGIKSLELRWKSRQHASIMGNLLLAAHLACRRQDYKAALRLLTYIKQAGSQLGHSLPPRREAELRSLVEVCKEGLEGSAAERVESGSTLMDEAEAYQLAHNVCRNDAHCA